MLSNIHTEEKRRQKHNIQIAIRQCMEDIAGRQIKQKNFSLLDR